MQPLARMRTCAASGLTKCAPRNLSSAAKRQRDTSLMRLLVTRPEPDALKLRALLEEHGHQAAVEPLLRVSFDDADPIDLEGVQALIATSRNALRTLKSHPALAEARR